MQKKPLFRRENTTAHRPNVHIGGEYRDQRNTKSEGRSEAVRSSMHSKERWGRDYTPLFKFLLSRVGSRWSDVYSEAIDRLDSAEPVFWLVALRECEYQDYVRIGESSYYSGLFIDERGLLQMTNPSVTPSSLVPLCKCCTHTFNGVRFTQSFRGLRSTVEPDGENAPNSSFKRTPDGAA